MTAVEVRRSSFPHVATIVSVVASTPIGHCVYCGVRLISAQINDPRAATKDHVVARREGGSGAAHNLVDCCRRCNSSKGRRGLTTWVAIMFRQAHDRPDYRWRVWRLTCPAPSAWGADTSCRTRAADVCDLSIDDYRRPFIGGDAA